MIRSATPFPLVSLFFMFIGFVLNNVGHIRPHRTILAFVSGIFFILSGSHPHLLSFSLSLYLVLPHLTLLWCLFLSPVFSASAGLSLVVGLVLYISSINYEMMNRTRSSEAYLSYKYGWSFAFAAISFLLTEVSLTSAPHLSVVLTEVSLLSVVLTEVSLTSVPHLSVVLRLGPG